MNSIVTRLSDHRRTLAVLGTFAACLIGASGSVLAAAPADTAPSVTVAYGDLNLASEQGSGALYARIVAAARQVCYVGSVDIRDLQRYNQARSCEARAIAAAVQAVHSPQLAAIHSARQPHG
jgi:UrcA family protein